MSKTKKVLFFLFFIFYSFSFLSSVSAQEPERAEIIFFYSPTCPHCHAEHEFLDEIAPNFPEVVITRLDVTVRDTTDRLNEFYADYQVPFTEHGIVPITFIDGKTAGRKYFLGYDESIDETVVSYLQEIVSGLKVGNQDSTPLDAQWRDKVRFPLIGEIKLDNLSPMLLSVTVGALDGFNARAMVALGFLLAILISTGRRKKVVIVGGTFILVSGVIYFLFISAWLNLFIFLGYLKIITVVVAVVILIFGALLLREYIYGVICKICNVQEDGREGLLTKWQRGLLSYMNNLVSHEMNLLVMLAGVALVAAGINLIELFCSFGLPLAYTKVLTAHNLPTLSYYGYLLVYVIFYMIDDFIIFMIAVATLRITKISDKYLKAVKLISGVVLIILALLMLFKPELLSLG